jgi:hypothetical protein
MSLFMLLDSNDQSDLFIEIGERITYSSSRERCFAVATTPVSSLFGFPPGSPVFLLQEAHQSGTGKHSSMCLTDAVGARQRERGRRNGGKQREERAGVSPRKLSERDGSFGDSHL